MDILKNLSQILRTRTIAHSSVTIIGTGINGVLGVLFFIFLARALGPESFGIFSISIVVLTLFSDIADFGINTGLINFIGRHIHSSRDDALRFLKLGLTLKLMISLAVLAIGFILAPTIARVIFLKPELSSYLVLSFIGVGGAMTFSFITNSLQALQRYKAWAVLNIACNALRLLIVLLLAFIFTLTTVDAVLVYIALPFFGFFLGLFLLPKKFLTVKNEKSVLNEFFHYNKWVALSILVAAVSSRLDSFFVTRFLSIEQVGFYSVGVQLSSILPQFSYAIAAVAAPKIASYGNKKELMRYLKKLQLLCLGIALLGLVLSPIVFIIIPLVYGISYKSSVIPFLLLLYSQLIFLISIPSHQTIFYYLSNPKIFVVISTIILATMILLNYILVPILGITGAALTVLIGSLINFILPGIYVLKKLK